MSDTFDAAQVWRDIEDHLVTNLRLTLGERVLYYHLLRHSHAEDKRVAQVSKRSLARRIGTSSTTAHLYLRRLAQKGCVRIVDRGLEGTAIEVLLPGEIPGCLHPASPADFAEFEDQDYSKNERLRVAILNREQSRCFYCLRQLRAGTPVFDHAVPMAAGGDNSYRNIVACCFDCNSRKKDRPAEEFLRELYRASRLSDAEFDARLAALEALHAGHLVPQLHVNAIVDEGEEAL